MAGTTSTMTEQAKKCNDTQLLENAFGVNGLKEEECLDDDFAGDKVQVSETAIIIGNLICDKMNQYDMSTTMDNVKTEEQHDAVYDNLKIEEWINADIRTKPNNGFLYCEDCHLYYEDYCAKCDMLVHILNRTVPINSGTVSQEELPNDILEIHNYFGEYRTFALKVIPVGVTFGPFTGLHTTECLWKTKRGKFVVNGDESKCLNWMQYINPAKNISEQNLLVFQYEHNLYYQSTCQIQAGDELLVYLGKEYEDNLNSNVEIVFVPNSEHIFKDAFACTFCCLGFRSKAYLAKHKTICLKNASGRFSIEELTQCPSCKIHLEREEYIIHHMAYCREKNYRKCILPTTDNRTAQVNERKTQPLLIYKCQQCKYKTKYKDDFKNHTNLHYEVKTHKCEICCRRFKTKEVLRLHMEDTHSFADVKEYSGHSIEVYASAHVKVEYSCSQEGHAETEQLKERGNCDFKTNWQGSVTKQIGTKHLRKIIYKCDTCDYKARLKFQLKRHINTRHLKEFKYKCNICDYKTNFKCNLKTHIEAKHLKEFQYKCNICDYKTNFKCNLKTHIEAKHLKEFQYKCNICDYKTNFKSHLKTHVEARHLKEFKYKCGICDYKTNIKCNLKRHIDTKHLKRHIDTKHLKEYKYKCETCDYKTNVTSHLKTHMETRHLRAFKYKCHMCDYKANLQPQLKRHIDARHLEGFKYKCETCDYETNSKSHLKTHVETRCLKESKHNCELCDYKTNIKCNLKRHIETRHLKEYKYKCGRCDYKTNQKSNLKAHIETKHLKEYKYKCDGCNYKTNHKFNLQTHVETRHLKELKYKCDMCDYKTNLKCNLKSHIQRKHIKDT